MLKKINAKMLELNAHAVQYIKVQGLKDATGLIGVINHQINKDFGLAGPFTITTPSSRVHAVRWAMARECFVVENEVPRITKEIIAASVAQINKCPYCVDVHGASATSAGGGKIASQIEDGTYMNIQDKKLKSIIEWSLNSRNPEEDIIRNPPFSKKEAPEIIGTALAFHSTNRLVSIFLDETPMPGILGNEIFRKTALNIASKTLFKSMVSKKAISGEALRFIEEYPKNAKVYQWAEDLPAFQQALQAQKVLVEIIEHELIPAPVAYMIKKAITNWNGEDMPMGRAWLKTHLDQLDAKHHPIAQLALLAAFTPYTITDKDIAIFREVNTSDQELVELCYWAISIITHRIAEWLIKPFSIKK